MCFSSGTMAFIYFCQVVHLIDPDSYTHIRHKMPKFLVSFSGPSYGPQKFMYKGKLYAPQDYVLDMNSLHSSGLQDPFLQLGTDFHFFKNPVLIIHPDGHKIPRQYSA